MNVAPEIGRRSAAGAVEAYDVIIVGAGISGVDAAHHLKTRHPDKSFLIIDAKEEIGGTWATHRYPGVRSDSDLYTFGFGWKPWLGPPIATGPEILAYLSEAVEEEGIAPHIRFGQRLERASWSTEAARWRLDIEGRDGPAQLECRFLWMCQGYYRHEGGHSPDFPGSDQFRGVIAHPQDWPDDLDHQGKRVVVIGSGATAATVVPAMAETAAEVVMLQRSPTFFAPLINRNELAETLIELEVEPAIIHDIARRKALFDSELIARRSFEEPEALREELIAAARAMVGPDCDVDTHFNPSYRPWRQRLAALPDGDLFKAIHAGRARVVTDQVDRFTETGIRLRSGDELAADIIVTATGFDLSMMGGASFEVDGAPVDWSQTWTHRGILFSGVPNMAWVFGYLRSSWTLRADLVCDFVCRLLSHMDEEGAATATPQLRPEDADMPALPWIDPENFNAGYLTRSMHLLPKRGDRAPWIFTQDYFEERHSLPVADLEDGTLIYR